ncbi:hypothetical protein G6F37_000417 [Rhizopus arrhizus]|nr:hypothetical protein G6F38_003526 [Rhizopus arrhizus]KAG1164288.1 hypothetical protein G6F37_000417 [Rhizopus arrhizus]
MAFSSAIVLTDLNDYISPSQACIKPVEIEKSQENKGPSEIKVDKEGGYYEISQDDGKEKKLEKASISLNDCLACSGCVTSAESVLISMQSLEEFYKILEQKTYATTVISISPQSRASLAAKYQLTPIQVHKRLIYFFKHILGIDHVFDTAFTQDLSLVESAREFMDRFKFYMANGGEEIERVAQQQQQQEEGSSVRSRRGGGVKAKKIEGMPMLASSCPGWVCYAEKTHGEILPYISTTKSPQQMMGSLVKNYLANKTNTSANQIYHVTVMPCYDKKLEASRPDFQIDDIRDVDCVLTTSEIDQMLQSHDFLQMPEAPVEDMFNKVGVDPETSQETVFGVPGSSSGGGLEYIMATAARELFGASTDRVMMKVGKNADVCEYSLMSDDGRPLLRFASAYGFRNIQNLVRKIKQGKCIYHYVEVMACPGGCANGGGQIIPVNVNAKEWLNQVESIYRSAKGVWPEENEMIKTIYNEWIGDDIAKRQLLLHTQYHAVTQSFQNPLATKWLTKELRELHKNPPEGVVVEEADNFLKWKLCLTGAPGTIYEGEQFKLEFRFTPQYPLEAPDVVFVRPFVPMHPHVITISMKA